MTEKGLQIVEPKPEHFEEFIKARHSIIENIGGDIVNKYNSVSPEERDSYSADNIMADFPERAKKLGDKTKVTSVRESLDFPFTQPLFDAGNFSEISENFDASGKITEDISPTAYDNFFVNHHQAKKAEQAKNPDLFYFIMDEDKIIGAIGVRARKLMAEDKAQGVEGFAKWQMNDKNGNVVDRIPETYSILLPQYRNSPDMPKEQRNTYMTDARAMFYEKIRKEFGIEEISGTVVIGNEASKRSQMKALERCGGKTYSVDEGSKTRFIVNTDTSGKSKVKYNMVALNQGQEKTDLVRSLSALRNGNNLNLAPKMPEKNVQKQMDSAQVLNALGKSGVVKD